MTLKAPAAMVINWPRRRTFSRFGRFSARPDASPEKQIRKLEAYFDEAKAYQRARQSDAEYPIDARLEAMLPVLKGEIPMLVTADDVEQIQAAVAFAAARNLKLIIYGGYDAPDCAALLKQQNVPVIVSAIYRTPRRRDDPVDAPYTIPARLHAHGIRFSIAGTGRFGASMLRNLPYHAGTAAAHGLDRDQALRAVTISAAEIIGAADRIGSLEVGKDASLIVTDGDPLEITTHVLAAYIQGRAVDLNDRHKQLWRKYQQKYDRQDSEGLASPGETLPDRKRKSEGDVSLLDPPLLDQPSHQ